MANNLFSDYLSLKKTFEAEILVLQGSKQNNLKPLTHLEVYDLDPLTHLEVINLEPLTQLEALNLDPLSLSQHIISTSYASG
jgi:hypothetical protein